ncbi:MAG TPA: serine hydrolase [Planctomycetaceae bacterium]|nr:serine hydrolase [Planctomycetaceae bacterium]
MWVRVGFLVMVVLPTAVSAAEPAAIIEKLTAAIQHELAAKQIPAMSIALVDGDRVVWQAGFGLARPKEQRKADEHTVYRVGSVSKLYADIAAMQLVEQGKLALDEPIATYLPDFGPRDPFELPITLRQLMSHRSGLVREPPVGHYFDPDEPSLEATVRSLHPTAIVYQPETRTKYSNAAVAVVGYLVEKVSGQTFEAYVDQHILKPLGMTESALRITPAVEERLANAVMWGLDGRVFPAPKFELGTSPAGNLYSSVHDQAKFLRAILAAGDHPTAALLKPDTWRQMWQPQFTNDAAGYGLGFSVAQFDGTLRVGHGGAVYGFATQLAALPGEKLGVIGAASKDCANGTVTRLCDYALRLMRADKKQEALPEYVTSSPLPAGLAREMAGRFALGDRALDFQDVNDRLFVTRGYLRREVRTLGDHFVLDDEFAYGPEIQRTNADRWSIDGETWTRQRVPCPPEPPDKWRGLIGEYGWDHNELFILEDQGRLYALIEWFFRYPLTELSPSEFAFPDDGGLYHGERLIFKRDKNGQATHVVAAEVKFVRRDLPGSDATFRITPQKPVDELRQIAMAAQPPAQSPDLRPSQLVDLMPLDAALKFDIRYATTNNFLSTVFYPEARAFAQKDAAEALLRVHQALAEDGKGLLIYDAYRPWFVTKMFYDATPDALRHFVADPAKGSRHNRGCAIDLTLYDLAAGEPLQMPSGYDEFSAKAYPGYPGGTSRSRWQRELLRLMMHNEGFRVYEFEWWHFDYGPWREYPVLNLPFDKIAK